MNQLVCRYFFKCLSLVAALAVMTGCSSPGSGGEHAADKRIKAVKDTYGTYDAEPRMTDGRVDVDRLVSELTAIKAKSYNFLVWRAANDWDDLTLLLPKAREKNNKTELRRG